MSIGLSTRSLVEGARPEVLLTRARSLDCRGLFLSAPLGLGEVAGRDLRGGGVELQGVQVTLRGLSNAATALAQAVDETARLRAPVLVVDLARGASPDEELATSLARLLHPLLRSGVPLGVRDGVHEGGLLCGEVLDGLLGDLRDLRLWADPARRATAIPGQAARDWPDALGRLAGRCSGVFVHSRLGGADGGHPEEGDVNWALMADLLPRRAAWVLDVGPGLSQGDLEQALRYLRMLLK